MAALDDVGRAPEPLQIDGAADTALAVPVRAHRSRHAVAYTRHRRDIGTRGAGVVALVREEVLPARLALADGVGYLARRAGRRLLRGALAADWAGTTLDLCDGGCDGAVANEALAARFAERLAAELLEFAGGTLVANRRRMSRDVLASGTAEALGVAAWFWRIGSVGAVARRFKKEERIKVQNYGTANTTTRMALTWKWVCV